MKKVWVVLLATVAAGAFAHDREFEYTLKARNGSDDKIDITCDNGASYTSVQPGATQSIGFSSGDELNLNCAAIGPAGEQLDQKQLHAHRRKPVVNWNVRHQHAYTPNNQRTRTPAQYDQGPYGQAPRSTDQYVPPQRGNESYAPAQRLPDQQNYQR